MGGLSSGLAQIFFGAPEVYHDLHAGSQAAAPLGHDTALHAGAKSGHLHEAAFLMLPKQRTASDFFPDASTSGHHHGAGHVPGHQDDNAMLGQQSGPTRTAFKDKEKEKEKEDD